MMDQSDRQLQSRNLGNPGNWSSWEILSAFDSGVVKLFDIRCSSRGCALSLMVSPRLINACRWNPYDQHCFAVGAHSGSAVWDIRCSTQPLVTISKNVPCSLLRWRPGHPTHLSTATHKVVSVWDILRPTLPIIRLTGCYNSPTTLLRDFEWFDSYRLLTLNDDRRLNLHDVELCENPHKQIRQSCLDWGRIITSSVSSSSSYGGESLVVAYADENAEIVNSHSHHNIVESEEHYSISQTTSSVQLTAQALMNTDGDGGCNNIPAVKDSLQGGEGLQKSHRCALHQVGMKSREDDASSLRYEGHISRHSEHFKSLREKSTTRIIHFHSPPTHRHSPTAADLTCMDATSSPLPLSKIGTVQLEVVSEISAQKVRQSGEINARKRNVVVTEMKQNTSNDVLEGEGRRAHEGTTIPDTGISLHWRNSHDRDGTKQSRDSRGYHCPAVHQHASLTIDDLPINDQVSSCNNLSELAMNSVAMIARVGLWPSLESIERGVPVEVVNSWLLLNKEEIGERKRPDGMHSTLQRSSDNDMSGYGNKRKSSQLTSALACTLFAHICRFMGEPQRASLWTELVPLVWENEQEKESLNKSESSPSQQQSFEDAVASLTRKAMMRNDVQIILALVLHFGPRCLKIGESRRDSQAILSSNQTAQLEKNSEPLSNEWISVLRRLCSSYIQLLKRVEVEDEVIDRFLQEFKYPDICSTLTTVSVNPAVQMGGDDGVEDLRNHCPRNTMTGQHKKNNAEETIRPVDWQSDTLQHDHQNPFHRK